MARNRPDYYIKNLIVGSLKVGSRVSNVDISTHVLSNAAATALKLARFWDLGAPIAKDDNRIVVSANMKVGTYTIAAQPDVARSITIKHTTVGGVADTLGTITVAGCDIAGNTITWVATPEAGVEIESVLAFSTISSITGAGWVRDAGAGTEDTIIIGVGNKLGLLATALAADIKLGFLDSTGVKPVTAGDNPLTLAGFTVDLSDGTYDGTKKASVIAMY